MTHTPSIDYSCSQCGASQTYHVVPGHAHEHGGDEAVGPREIPSIDLSCSRCGASQSYRIVPISVTSPASNH